MTTEAAMSTLHAYGSVRATVQIWGSTFTSRSFDTLREALLFLGDKGGDESPPSIEIHSDDGIVSVSGPGLQTLIAQAKAVRSAS
ncbi:MULTISPECIES: hypothetical protein [unclassified Bosea (in: a-proteobacteria)]|uniref:hypothetical protein n=1 Tax=unclassified Bosea (in: a-proteobacteria) TaxID=2653178 RepID=UPI000F759065|nr:MULTISPECIES: hypothetical protein [unclassified Bosea (in: a-proteobacteria)]AZO81825.1 hypothetical protein BLM15_28825 [Bosea sp. Tri-49]RXT24913.1 hypothetical protein B5U98_08045 [Bosea sp. Tri-39]RXT33465.1 hypothetical protein B5U99_18475 [Bosea sp. Tri-54]